MKFSHVATALLLVTALVTVTNPLHLPTMQRQPETRALAAEIDSAGRCSGAGEAFARATADAEAASSRASTNRKPPPLKRNFAQ